MRRLRDSLGILGLHPKYIHWFDQKNNNIIIRERVSEEGVADATHFIPDSWFVIMESFQYMNTNRNGVSLTFSVKRDP